MIRNFQIYLFCLLTFGLIGCSVTRHVDEGDHLIARVRFEGMTEPDLKSGLKDNMGFRPNKRILGYYPFYLQAWNFGKDGRDTSKIRRFVREKIGERPVLLDSLRLEAGTRQLELYLFNNGYFNAEVSYEVKTRKKKATVIYKIEMKEPYTVDGVEYRVYDKKLYSSIMKDTMDSEIDKGDRFDTDDLITERERLTQDLRNQGYYFFDKEYVSFDVDSGIRTVDIAVEVKNPRTFRRHEVYRFDEVYVDVNYPYYLHGTDDSTFTDVNGVNIRTQGMPIKPELLARLIRIDSGSIYRDRAIMYTYNRFFDLQIFANVRINTVADTATKLVNVWIYLEPNPAVEFGAEPQIITSDQSSAVQAVNQRVWGLSGLASIRHKNLFRGAEVLDFTLTNSAEFQYTDRKFVVSNFRQSLSSSLIIPKLIWFSDSAWAMKKIQKKRDIRRPVTNFNLTFSYELNKDFVQRTSQLSMSYAWTSRYNSFRIVPVEWNLNQVSVKSDFLKNLTPGDRVLLSSLLNPNFIPAWRIEWYYDDKGLSSTGNYHKFRWNVIELAGNVFYGVLSATTPKPADGVYKVLNTNLFQYAKTDFDLRYYQFSNPDIRVAYRMHAGLAFPYLNSSVIPFEKRFFIGGANSLRGWRPRSIGPGSYSSFDENQIDRSGEIVLEGSTELRFRIITKALEGAIFADAGNIWNVHKDTSLPGAHFEADFFRDFALNGGIGLRFDFSFFLVRLDMGTQFRDPSYKLNRGWVFNDHDYFHRRITFNFGIGYPF